MSNQIHPTAMIAKSVQLGSQNEIGPHVIIEDGVTLGSNNCVMANAYICQGTEIGDGNQIHMSAVIGHVPQDVAYKSAATYTRIGNYNVIREFVTIHRGTKEGSATIIGNNNLLMANAHVAHNCIIGNFVTLVNLASLSGHCVVEDQAFISGMTGFHQFTRVGRLAMVSALSAINKDIPPFMVCGGRPGVIQGVNVVGLRRAGANQAGRNEIKEAFRLLYRSGLNVSQALSEIEQKFRSKEIGQLIEFIRTSKRGIANGREKKRDSLSLEETSKNVLREDLEVG